MSTVGGGARRRRVLRKGINEGTAVLTLLVLPQLCLVVRPSQALSVSLPVRSVRRCSFGQSASAEAGGGTLDACSALSRCSPGLPLSRPARSVLFAKKPRRRRKAKDEPGPFWTEDGEARAEDGGADSRRGDEAANNLLLWQDEVMYNKDDRAMDMSLTEDEGDSVAVYDGYNGAPSMDLPDDFDERKGITTSDAFGSLTGVTATSRDGFEEETSGGTRNLEDMLMERSTRFYDPKLTRGLEKAFLVGLEDRGRAVRRRQAREDADQGWDEEEQERLAAERKKDREDTFTLEESLSELSELAGTAGLEVVGTTYQRVLEPNPRTYIGTGKVKEVKRACQALGCCTVVLDRELSPGQQRNLENEFGGEESGIKVLDRTALILDIFSQHARTKEGQLQVELALNLYRLPRLTKLWTHLERQAGSGGGGSSGTAGLRGPGEKQLEVDRRLIKESIQDLQKSLVNIRRHRDLHRRRRDKLGMPIIALVGYTNAGKSTLLNGLTKAGVFAENMLFATLDPTTRRVRLPGARAHPEVMVTDTVGFIQKLPTNLVAAFRATLEEVVEADVIVHVVDISSPSWGKQMSAVMKVLADMVPDDTPIVTLWNKVDLLSPAERERVTEEAKALPLTVAASSLEGQGMEGFISAVEDALDLLLEEVEALVPYDKGELMNLVHSFGACDVEEYRDGGTYIKARVPDEAMNRLEPYFTEEFRQARLAQLKEIAVDDGEDNNDDDVDWAAIAKRRHKTQGDALDALASL